LEKKYFLKNSTHIRFQALEQYYGQYNILPYISINKYIYGKITGHKYIVQKITAHKYIVQKFTGHKYIYGKITDHKYIYGETWVINTVGSF
jgi:hypothetical protein